MVEMEKDIYELRSTVEKLASKISESETQPDQTEKQKLSSEGRRESSSEGEDLPPQSKTELEIKVAVEGKDKTSPAGVKEPDKPTEPPGKKFVTGPFSWGTDKSLQQQCEDIKKKFESMKESDQKKFWVDMVVLQETNKLIVEKLDDLLVDFNTVMNSFSKLGTQVEELETSVNKKVKIDDDLENLKQQIDRLDAYVYTGKYKPEEEEIRLPGEGSVTGAVEHPEFVKGEVEKLQQLKQERESHFVRTVKNLMTMPEERRAEIVKEPMQPEFKRVKPTTMKKDYEKFIAATHETRVGKKESRSDLKEGEKAEKIDIDQFQTQTEIPTSELVVPKGMFPPIGGTAQKKFHTTAQVVTLAQTMQETQRLKRLAKARKHSWRDTDDGQPQLSTESLDIIEPLPKQASVEKFRPLGKATLLTGDDKAFQQLKERIVLYIKTRLEELEDKFMDQMQTMENSIVHLQHKIEASKEEVRASKARLGAVEVNQSKSEGRLIAVENKAALNYLHIEEMMIALDKKADRCDVMHGVTIKDLAKLEDTMHKINETVLSDLEEMKSCVKHFNAKFRGDLDEKVSGFEMDLRLEPLAGRLKKLEKFLKDVSFTVAVLERQSKGPIEVKRFLHCEDGKRIMPPRRPVSHWTSATLSKMPAPSCIFDDGEDAANIEADISKRLEDASIRGSKHLIGGAYTKSKVARK